MADGDQEQQGISERKQIIRTTLASIRTLSDALVFRTEAEDVAANQNLALGRRTIKLLLFTFIASAIADIIFALTLIFTHADNLRIIRTASHAAQVQHDDTARALSVAQRETEENAQSQKMQLRAYITNAIGTPPSAPGYLIAASFVKNTGLTPAHDVRVTTSCGAISHRSHKILFWLTKPVANIGDIGASTETSGGYCSIKAEALADRKADRRLMGVTSFNYKDVYGDPRVTAVCSWIDYDTSGNNLELGTCPNMPPCTDNECPKSSLAVFKKSSPRLTKTQRRLFPGATAFTIPFKLPTSE